uniref:Adenylate isopentenyltransferase n=1 Tax=Kalanchoe fedtschenkoi TaxID=63787 RepID=A0A7N0ZVF4_KALFE
MIIRHCVLKPILIVIMGATGTGKSRLSIDLATRFYPTVEVINADKIQVYKGLDITTNKLPLHHRCNVPHHLLAELDTSAEELTRYEYRQLASSVVSDIVARRKLPVVVGGSNSFIQALVGDQIDPVDREGIRRLRYRCCFLWIDVEMQVLREHLCRRVDQMVKAGMINELAEFYGSIGFTGRAGIGKAIGIAEFKPCFKPGGTFFGLEEEEGCCERAVEEVKVNTCRLAVKQIRKIQRLREAGWDLKRVDATAAFRAAEEGKTADEAWEMDVVGPSVKLVQRFLGL